MQNSIQTQIREQIDIAFRNAIIVSPAYLDDEQLPREGQFAVLTEIFNTNVRNNEIREVCSHFAPIFQDGHPIHLSVLGKTGTGKTITLLYLLHEFEQLCAEKGIPFQQYHLDLCCPAPCFRALNTLACHMGASKFYKRGISLEDLMLSIENHLRKMSGYVTIFVDEADNIRTDPNTFFTFLVKRLPHNVNVKVILLFASNRLNWSENLDPRIKSCLKMRELIFEPYDAPSLQKILSIRVEKALRPDSVEDGVIEKIAALSSRNHGDARKAVDLLTRSAYLSEKKGQRITHETVDAASEEIERDKYLAMVRTSPKHLQAALYSALTGKQKGRALRTGDAYLLYDNFCRKAGLTPLTQRAFTDLLSELDMYGFIRASTVSLGRYGRTKDIFISISPTILEQMKRLILSNFDLSNEVIYE
jgi:cell division control protein 6